MKSLFQWLLAAFALVTFARADDAVWQWSVPIENGRAFLWIPERCERVRAVVLSLHNMSEEGVLEHPHFRTELARLGIAEVWIVPPIEVPFDFHHGAGERFEGILAALGRESGYTELSTAPVVPFGHSACASYPWNFAAWKPERTLALISYKGDAPQTNMTGHGRANIPWEGRSIDGVPALMVMAEYEWLEGRLAPALAFRAAHPAAPIAMLAEPGRGHFDTSDEMVRMLTLFLRKAAEARLPADVSGEPAPALRFVDPARGWLVQRWTLDRARTMSPAPAAEYRGDPREAFWAFDEETAVAFHHFRERQVGKKPQLLGFRVGQSGEFLPQTNVAAQVMLKFEPIADGSTVFRLRPDFLPAVDGGSPNATRWTGLPPGTPLGHAASGEVVVSRITGPAMQVAPDLFRVHFNRVTASTPRGRRDIWFAAAHEGDGEFKSIVQQALLRVPEFKIGREQTITFPAIRDQPAGTPSVALAAFSDAEMPVDYCVREGPAFVRDGVLYFTAVPPRAKWPVRITVVAWQLGRGAPSPIKEAAPVERSFWLRR